MDSDTAKTVFKKKQSFSKGKRGTIYKSRFNSKYFIIKTRQPESSSPGTIQNEHVFTEKLNKIGIGPKAKYFDKDKDFLIREFVDGQKIEDWVIENKDKPNFKERLLKILKNILLQCKTMDDIKINKQELTNPHKDILITKQDVPVIIDFERCRFTLKPKNTTQFLQYISRPFMLNILKDLSIDIKQREIIALGEAYKNNPSKEAFSKILSLLS